MDVSQYLPNIKNTVYCLLGGASFNLSKLKLCKLTMETPSFSVAENCWVLHESLCLLLEFEKPAKRKQSL